MRIPLAFAAVPILLLLSTTASAHGADDSELGSAIRAVDARLVDLQEALLTRSQTPSVRRRFSCATRARELLADTEGVSTAAEQARIAARVARITRAKFANNRDLSTAVRKLNGAFEALIHHTLEELHEVATKGRPKRVRRRVRRLHHRADLSPSVVAKLLWNSRALRAAGTLAFGDDLNATFVVSAVGLSESGVDLDQDGDSDNSLSAILAAADQLGLDLDVNMLFDELVSTNPVVTLLQIWRLDSFTDDPFIQIGVVPGLDTDGDTGDNASGTEEFVVLPALLGDDGFPLARAAGTLESGGFSVAVDSTDLDLGGVELPVTTLIRLAGSLTEAGAEGQIGVAVPVEVLTALLAAAAEAEVADLPPLGPILALAADVDTDGDGDNDALALVLDFEAAPAVTTTEF